MLRRISFNVLAGALLLLTACTESAPKTAPREPYRFPTESSWRSGYQLFVYGQPPVDYLEAIKGTAIVWSVYHAGTNPKELAYVRDLHARGIRVASNFASMQGSVSVTGDEALNKRTACGLFDGEPAYALWIVPDPPYLPCNNNSEWLSFLQKRAYEHADGEVDALHIDEVEGISGHLYMAGFDEHCLSGFRKYLAKYFSGAELASQFAITDVTTFNYRDYLKAADFKRINDDPNPALRRAYVRFQLVSRHESMHDMVVKTRAAHPEKYIAFSANTFFLNANKMGFLEDLDFLVFENSIDFPPAGKHFGEHFLAQAAAPGKPSAMFPNIINLLNFKDGKHWNIYLHWIMEAFAAGQYFLIPHNAYVFGGGPESVSGNVTLPPKMFRPYADFMERNWDAHDAVPVAEIGVLFPFGAVLGEYIDKGYASPYAISEKTHLDYLDLTRRLQEAHVPFRTAFSGDGQLITRKLSKESLSGLRQLLIPTSDVLDAATEDVIASFIGTGGKVLRGEKLDVQAVAKATTTPWLLTDAPATVGLVPAQGANRFFLHVVNYDFRKDANEFHPTLPFKVTLRMPEGFLSHGPPPADQLQAILKQPGKKDSLLPVTTDGQKLSFSLENVVDYALVDIGLRERPR